MKPCQCVGMGGALHTEHDSPTVFFKLVVQGLRDIGVSYCVHKMTTGECLH